MNGEDQQVASWFMVEGGLGDLLLSRPTWIFLALGCVIASCIWHQWIGAKKEDGTWQRPVPFGGVARAFNIAFGVASLYGALLIFVVCLGWAPAEMLEDAYFVAAIGAIAVFYHGGNTLIQLIPPELPPSHLAARSPESARGGQGESGAESPDV